VRLVWLAQARADRRGIIEHIAQDNPAAAIDNDECIRDVDAPTTS
jgi:plasmid stabilization system protein ParE